MHEEKAGTISGNGQGPVHGAQLDRRTVLQLGAAGASALAFPAVLTRSGRAPRDVALAAELLQAPAAVQILASGWNTWDITYHTGVVHLPSGIQARFGLYDPATDAFFDGFTWHEGFAALGPHASDGSYCAVDVFWPNGSLPVVPASGLIPPSGQGHGLLGEYFANETLSGAPVVTQVDQSIGSQWNGASPAAGVPGINWSARWTGSLTATETGTYTLGLTSDDGSRLYVRDKLAINNWNVQPPTTATARVSLTAGDPVPIRIEYFQHLYGSMLSFGWAPPSHPYEILISCEYGAPDDATSICRITPQEVANGALLVAMMDGAWGSPVQATRQGGTLAGATTSGTWVTRTSPAAVPAPLPAFNNVGVTSNADTTPGDFDGVGNSYSAQALAAASPHPLTPGATVTVDGVTMTWPDVAAGQPDDIIAEGQVFRVSGTGTTGTALGILGASVFGTGTGTGAITYTDGTTQSYTLSFADWNSASPAPGTTVVTTTTQWNTPSGPNGSGARNVYFAAVPLQAGKTVSTVQLPDVSGIGSQSARMHIFALSAGLAGQAALAVPLTGPVLVATAPASQSAGPLDAATAGATLDRLRQADAAQRLSTGGWLQDSADGLVRAITWNTVWNPPTKQIVTPVSRDFGSNRKLPVVYEWDGFFCSMMALAFDRSLSEANFRVLLQNETDAGFVPNVIRQLGGTKTDDRSEPPVGAYCLLKAYRASSLGTAAADRDLLAWAYPLLLRYHRWWFTTRDGNSDGLLEWGSNPVPGEYSNNLQAARFESGLDNSPMYDDDHTVFNTATHTMELDDVGLNALYAADAWALSQIAAELGLASDALQLAAEYQTMGERINANLWNEQAGIYLNRAWDGTFSTELSPTLFYPLLAGIVPAGRAAQMVQAHLLNLGEFLQRFMLPSISSNDPAYADQNYWRGRAWGPMNFLVAEGLRRYGLHQALQTLADSGLRLFLGEWQSENHVHENYNAMTGSGEDTGNSESDPLYTWGALLAYVAMEQAAAPEAWNGWSFGHAGIPDATVRNLQVAEGQLTVTVTRGSLSVSLNNQALLASDAPVAVTGYQRTPGTVTFTATARPGGGPAANPSSPHPRPTPARPETDHPDQHPNPARPNQPQRPDHAPLPPALHRRHQTAQVMERPGLRSRTDRDVPLHRPLHRRPATDFRVSGGRLTGSPQPIRRIAVAAPRR